ncbi:biopolymer transporter ExbD [Marinobacter sp. KM021]|uniref:ExbD/TolR family protein n=1 Tax=Marinobacter sp. KM021 TaxID=3075616 RepID=UPI003D6B75BE
MKIKRGSAPAASNDDHLIPLINVVFLMLIFFMLAGQIRASDGLPFIPPAMDSGGPEVSAQVEIVMAEDGGVFLNGVPVQHNELSRAWAEGWGVDGAVRSQFPVLVKIDQALTAEQWQPVLAWVSEAGFESVHLSTRRSP